jgi:hypothetical protein
VPRGAKNDGAGGLTRGETFEAGEHPVYGTAADCDGDGDLDFAHSRFHHNKAIREVALVLNRGGGAFEPPRQLAAIRDQRQIAAGDLDGDGLPEILVGGRQFDRPPFHGGLVAVLPNRGVGAFGDPEVYPLSHADTCWAVQAADMDRDGDLGVITGSANFGTITVLYNDGSGRLTQRTELAGVNSIMVRAGDLDGDGLPEVVSRGGLVFKNLGAGSFAAPLAYAVGGGGEIFRLADMDASGTLDLVATHMGSSAAGTSMQAARPTRTSPSRMGCSSCATSSAPGPSSPASRPPTSTTTGA